MKQWEEDDASEAELVTCQQELAEVVARQEQAASRSETSDSGDPDNFQNHAETKGELAESDARQEHLKQEKEVEVVFGIDLTFLLLQQVHKLRSPILNLSSLQGTTVLY
jgi:hypothetical protein